MLAGRQQQAHEGRRLLLAADGRLPETEQFFELIDDDQEIRLLRQVRLLHRFDQSRAAARERGDQTRQRLDIVGVVQIGGEQGPSQVVDWVAAGTNHDHFPGRAGFGQRSAVQRGKQPSPDQRRLAASRRADHGQKPVLPQ